MQTRWRNASALAGGLLLILCTTTANAVGRAMSELWGSQGERYRPAGRLLDWSYAGYAAGELPIPQLVPTANVKDYGAVGDGLEDDTQAFLSAIAANKQGVLYIPPGRYIIRGFLNITTRLSLKGSGSATTTLVFPLSLAALYGDVGQDNNTHAASQWSFGTAFVNYNGATYHDDSTFIGHILNTAHRGTNTLKVSTLKGVKVGQWVSVTIGNPRETGKLFLDMNMDLHPGCFKDARCFDKIIYRFQSRVAQIKGKHTLVLERPLPYNISQAFAPAALHHWAPQLASIGVEGLHFEMMSSRYKDHFKETGFNALQLNNVSNSWVKDVVVTGADMALTIFGCSFMTVTQVTTVAQEGRAGIWNWTGHHGLFTVHTSDTLFTRFNIKARFVHDLSVDYFSHGVVWSQGHGVDLNMDHHKGQSYGILWTQLDLGLATRPFDSGGAHGIGLNAGSLTTYWNIESSNSNSFQKIAPADFGPALNFIGCGQYPRFPSLNLKLTSSWWVETMNPEDLTPLNIFLTQQAIRLASPNHVSRLLGGKGKGGKLLTAY